ncbi:MAG: hypothetical protein LH629_16230 [Ignavibacteria bacterium]|nr:hypothetical protein [Ignavibacteria bacterium]
MIICFLQVDPAEDEEQKLVIINKVFPNAFDEEQVRLILFFNNKNILFLKFYQTKNSFIEQWKRYHATTVATDTVKPFLFVFRNQFFHYLDIGSILDYS